MHFIPGEINIICTDAEISIAFYRDVLGFTLVEEEKGAFRLNADGTSFLLLPFATRTRPVREYCSTPDISFDLVVEDLEHAYTYLQKHHVRFIRPWTKDRTSFIIQDPDGLVIEVTGT